MKILIVDDNELNRNWFVLSSRICRCNLNGNRGRRQLTFKNEKFDVVLMDVQMPGWMGGNYRKSDRWSYSSRNCTHRISQPAEKQRCLDAEWMCIFPNREEKEYLRCWNFCTWNFVTDKRIDIQYLKTSRRITANSLTQSSLRSPIRFRMKCFTQGSVESIIMNWWTSCRMIWKPHLPCWALTTVYRTIRTSNPGILPAKPG